MSRQQHLLLSSPLRALRLQPHTQEAIEHDLIFLAATVVLISPASDSDYTIGSFLPVFLAVLLSIPIQILNINVKRMLPFRTLTHQGGAQAAADSLCLTPGGIMGFLTSFRLLRRFRDPISLLGDILVICSGVLVALSSETIGLKLHGTCDLGIFYGCYMSLSIFRAPTRSVEVLIIFMVVIIIALMFLLRKWRSGLPASPFNIFAMASLVIPPRVAEIFRALDTPTDGRHLQDGQVLKIFGNTRFALGQFEPQRRSVLLRYSSCRCEQAPRCGLPEQSRKSEARRTTRTNPAGKKFQMLPRPGQVMAIMATAARWGYDGVRNHVAA